MVIDDVKVYGLEDSIKKAKYPMSTDISKLNSELTKGIKALGNAERGSGHDNFLKGIIVQFDLTFTVKAWTEAERYHWLDFVSSQSTMHKIARFNLDDKYIEYVDPRIVEIMKEKVDEYNSLGNYEMADVKLHMDLDELKKKKYLEILYSNPCGFKLTAGMTTNYQQLKTIYYQRKSHKLPEWREFCAEIEKLPMFKELCLGGENDEE